MTKRELIEALNNAPNDAEIYFYDSADNKYYMIDIAYFDGDKVVLEERI